MSLLHATPLALELVNAEIKSFTFKDALLYVDADVATIYVQEPLQEIAQ